jgi:hypothetical protein
MAAPEKKKTSCGCMVIYAVLAFFGIAIFVGLVQTAGQSIGILPTPAPTATPTITPVPTSTPIPIVTDVPVATEVPTDVPILVPTATPLPSQSFTAEEQTFATEAMSIMTGYSNTMGKIGEQFTAVGNDPSLMFNDDWVTETAVAIAIFRELNNRVRALSVPLRFEASWAEMRIAADLYDQATDAIVEGIDNLNVERLNQGVQYMTEGNAAINRAQAALPAVP